MTDNSHQQCSAAWCECKNATSMQVTEKIWHLKTNLLLSCFYCIQKWYLWNVMVENVNLCSFVVWINVFSNEEGNNWAHLSPLYVPWRWAVQTIQPLLQRGQDLWILHHLNSQLTSWGHRHTVRSAMWSQTNQFRSIKALFCSYFDDNWLEVWLLIKLTFCSNRQTCVWSRNHQFLLVISIMTWNSLRYTACLSIVRVCKQDAAENKNSFMSKAFCHLSTT